MGRTTGEEQGGEREKADGEGKFEHEVTEKTEDNRIGC
jgi:hypothetical protein